MSKNIILIFNYPPTGGEHEGPLSESRISFFSTEICSCHAERCIMIAGMYLQRGKSYTDHLCSKKATCGVPPYNCTYSHNCVIPRGLRLNTLNFVQRNQKV
jgi:hypothetical protein